jgi:hypothetical protein
VKTILTIQGGSGNQVTSFLRKIGFVGADGSPYDLYRRFRNSSSTGAAAAALRFGYAPLYVRNEYMHQLSDDKLRGLIIEETGQGDDSAVVGLAFASIKAIKKFADWTAKDNADSRGGKQAIVSVTPSTGSEHPDGPSRLLKFA